MTVAQALGSKNRLLGAWTSSMAARSVALVPLPVFALNPGGASTSSARSYIFTFTFVTATSYVLNVMTEYGAFGAQKSTHFNLLAPAFMTIATFLALSGPVRMTAPDFVVAVGAVICQPLVARDRVATIASSKYQIGYGSTLVRDAPAAGCALTSLFWAGAVTFLPLAFFAGCLAQTLALHQSAPTSEPARPKSEAGTGSAGALVVAGLSAVLLALYQPVCRALASTSNDARALPLYDLADRPGYMLALVVAGGVATELQRRWSRAPAAQAVNELRKATLMTMGMMAAASCGLIAAVSLWSPRDTLLDRGTFVPVAVPAMLANAAYLYAVLRTRFLMSQGRPAAVAGAYLTGLHVLLAIWGLGQHVTGNRTPQLVAWAAVGGFAAAGIFQTAAVKRGRVHHA